MKEPPERIVQAMTGFSGMKESPERIAQVMTGLSGVQRRIME
jgi:hypothetical protein